MNANPIPILSKSAILHIKGRAEAGIELRSPIPYAYTQPGELIKLRMIVRAIAVSWYYYGGYK